MKGAEQRLDSKSFLRIHRSAVVNVDRIAALTPWTHGEYVVTMHDGTRLHVSRMYSSRVDALIEAGGL